MALDSTAKACIVGRLVTADDEWICRRRRERDGITSSSSDEKTTKQKQEERIKYEINNKIANTTSDLRLSNERRTSKVAISFNSK